MEPTLPFEPEPIASLRARYQAALDVVWDATLSEDRPGAHRQYVFDFQMGMRMIISKDVLVENGPPELHISISFFTNTALAQQNIKSMGQAEAFVYKYFHMLGGQGTLKFIGFSEKKVPHWIVR